MATIQNGYRDGGLDWTNVILNSPLDLTPSGVFGNYQMVAGQVSIAYSGVPSISAPPSGGVTVIPPAGPVQRFQVIDYAGGANPSFPIVVSGSAAYNFGGSGNVVFITKAYSRAEFELLSGNVNSTQFIYNVKY